MSSSVPRPGDAVRGSTTGRPIMALFDLVGRRWVLRIIWELHVADGPLTFRALRGACGDVSSSVLTRRLHELTEVRLVEHRGEGYALTPIADGFVTSMGPVLDWSRAWAEELADPPGPPTDLGQRMPDAANGS